MRHLLVLAAALLVGCADPAGTETPTDGGPTGGGPTEEPIVAGTETVTTSWDVDLFTLFESPTIERFDTMDGRRQLDGMTIEVEHTSEATLQVENGGPVALAADDYAFQFDFLTIMQLGTVDGSTTSGEEGPPFFGPGIFQASLSVDLAVADTDPQTTGEVYEETFTDTLPFEAHYDWEETPTYLEAMIGEEPITVVVGGFSESWVYWNDDHGGQAYLLAGAVAQRYSGTLTVTYEYSPTEE